eukprot:gene15804-7108_t
MEKLKIFPWHSIQKSSRGQREIRTAGRKPSLAGDKLEMLEAPAGCRRLVNFIKEAADIETLDKIQDTTQYENIWYLKPLRNLTKKNAKFNWTERCEEAFNTLKDLLTSSPVVSYFYIEKETTVIVDASPVGLSAILCQRKPGSAQENIVAFAITDHKPLVIIYANPCFKPPARIERWILRSQQYDFEVVYKSGIENPADYLSRHPTSAEYKKQNIADEYVNFVTQEAVFPALSLGEIKAATDKDTTLRITPHTTTKVPPAQLLYNRPVKGKLPMLPRKHKNINRHREARENDQLRKENAMNYANKRRNTKECDIKVGDLVICMQKKTNKFLSRFNVQPYKVVRVHGSKVVARHGDHFISRNSSFFKKVQQRLDGNIAAAADDDDNVEYHKRATEEISVRRSARSRILTQFYGDPINSRLIR